VFCTEEILAEAGIPVPDSESDEDDEVVEEEEVERFREFSTRSLPRLRQELKPADRVVGQEGIEPGWKNIGDKTDR